MEKGVGSALEPHRELGLAWLGLAWLGLAWPGLALLCSARKTSPCVALLPLVGSVRRTVRERFGVNARRGPFPTGECQTRILDTSVRKVDGSPKRS
ncbi:hypothetical protein HZH68_006968 [Vespula germanica]|uniref:Uncharacterized protein n=1 Tax=Vespula germanica TaxID=30212 RepID=A0A834NBB2_VESGE|nr:hypothetical protein HZH68_006968 [Vespula germanica]